MRIANMSVVALSLILIVSSTEGFGAEQRATAKKVSVKATCKSEVITPVLQKQEAAVLGDPIIIQKAALEIDPDATKISEIAGLEIVCDPETQGEDCQARRLKLSTGEKLILKAPIDYISGVKKGDLIIIDPADLLIVDRSISHSCTRDGKFTHVSLSDRATVLSDRYLEQGEFWGMRRALTGESLRRYVVKSDTEYAEGIVLTTRTPFTVEGMSCAKSFFIKVQAPKVSIPEVDMSRIHGD